MTVQVISGGLGYRGNGLGTTGLGARHTAPNTVYRDAIIADRPISYWRLNDPNTTVAIDTMGVNNGTPGTSGITYSVGGALTDNDFAMSFNGTNFIQLGNAASLRASTGTLECWVKTTAVAQQAIFAKNAAYGMWVLGSGALAAYDFTSGQFRQATRLINDNNWHHIVLTYVSSAAATSLLYIDGTVDSAGFLYTVLNQDNNFNIASFDSGTQFLNGSIDECAFYNYFLSAAQIARHYRLARQALPALLEMPTTALPYIAHVYDHNMQFKRTLGPIVNNPSFKQTYNAGFQPITIETSTANPNPNLVPDPGFELDNVVADVSNLWTLSDSGEAAINTTAIAGDVATGRHALKITTTRLVGVPWNFVVTKTPYAIVPGQNYLCSGKMRSSAGAKQGHIKLEWFDKAGAFLDQSFITGGVDGPSPWTTYSQTFTAPANAVTARYDFVAGYWDGVTGVNAWFILDDARMVLGSSTDDPVQLGDVIRLTEQGDSIGSIVFSGNVEDTPDEIVVGEAGTHHLLAVTPWVSELGDAFFDHDYSATAVDVAQFVRDAVATTAHCSVTPISCPNTGVTAKYDFNNTTALDAIHVAKQIAGTNWWWFVDEEGIVWFQSMSNTARITLKRSVDYNSRKTSASIVGMKNKVVAIGGPNPSGVGNLTATYNGTVSQGLYGLRNYSPTLTFPTVTDQATLTAIVNSIGGSFDRVTRSIQLELPAFTTRIQLGIAGGATVRYWEPNKDSLTQSESGSAFYSPVYCVQDVETDGLKQILLVGDVPITGIRDIQYEIDRMVARMAAINAALPPLTAQTTLRLTT